MKTPAIAIVAALLTLSVAAAHQGVQNAAVKARMDGMSAIAKHMKIIGLMAKGQSEFDADIARNAAAAIANHAAETPQLFEANETDPKSEARPEIWTSFSDFTGKAKELESIAQALSGSINAAADLGPALSSLGATCKSCHEAYRD